MLPLPKYQSFPADVFMPHPVDVHLYLVFDAEFVYGSVEWRDIITLTVRLFLYSQDENNPDGHKRSCAST